MLLSILIRNLNEAKTLQQTLLSLKKQQTDFEYEIVVVDNESDDNSVEIATQMGCKVVSLKREAFTFGYSLNYGIEKCGGEFILILSAHVILLNEFFLQNIPQYFKDEKIAALRFVQPASVEQVADSLLHGPRRLVHSANADFATDNWKNFIVNHCAAVRKSVWELISFDEQIFASEDKIWSLAILKKGYSILYNVPGFYVYAKPFARPTKIKRTIMEEAAREVITGKIQLIFSPPYVRIFLVKVISGVRQTYIDLKNHRQVYKGISGYRKKYNDV